MDVLKCVPRFVRRKIKKGFARRRIRKEMCGLEHVVRLYRERDEAIANEDSTFEMNVDLVYEKAELETENVDLRREVAEVKGDYEKLVGTIGEVKRDAQNVAETKANHLATVLTGMNHSIDAAELGKYGIDEALARVLRETRSELESAKKRNVELVKDSLVGIVKGVCLAHGAKRMPLVVYHNGEVVYSSPRFEKMTERARYLASELEGNLKVRDRIDAGKKAKMEYADGLVFFVPEKLRNGEMISIAHYVPDGKSRKHGVYAKLGGDAVKEIYKTLKSLDKAGLEFVKHETE